MSNETFYMLDSGQKLKTKLGGEVARALQKGPVCISGLHRDKQKALVWVKFPLITSEPATPGS